MAAGLGFKNFVTGDILTAADANGYLQSQTVMVFADAAARTAAITSPQEGMITYLKDTNATQYYSGSAWVNVGGGSPLTTKGDLYTYSTADARLAVGTNGQVLTADSTAATGLAWANAGGGQFKEQVFTATNASYTIPSGITGFWAVLAGGGGGGGGTTAGSAYESGGGGGAGQVLETYFTISGDTTLNITIGAGGAGGTSGANGSNGSTTSIVGNTSSTTYASAIGGGGGGGVIVGTANSGASGGGNGAGGWEFAPGGGGAGWHAYAYNGATIKNNGQAINFALYGGGGAATLLGSTGHSGGNADVNNPQTSYGGYGVVKFGRLLGGGGTGNWLSTSPAVSFGGGYGVSNSAGTAATANTGGGGGGAGNNGTATAKAGGAGGSGIVIIRWVG